MLKREFDKLADGPVTPFKKAAHICAFPNEFALCARAEHDGHIVRVSEHLNHVVSGEGAIRFGDDENIAGRFGKAFPNRVAVALRGFIDKTRLRRLYFFVCARSSVVIYNDDFIDITACKKVLIAARIESFSLYVGKMTDTFFLFHMRAVTSTCTGRIR